MAMDQAKQSLEAAASYRQGVPPVSIARMESAVAGACELLQKCHYRRAIGDSDFLDVIPKVINSCRRAHATQAALPLASYNAESHLAAMNYDKCVGGAANGLASLYMEIGQAKNAITFLERLRSVVPNLSRNEISAENFLLFLTLAEHVLQ